MTLLTSGYSSSVKASCLPQEGIGGYCTRHAVLCLLVHPDQLTVAGVRGQDQLVRGTWCDEATTALLSRAAVCGAWESRGEPGVERFTPRAVVEHGKRSVGSLSRLKGHASPVRKYCSQNRACNSKLAAPVWILHTYICRVPGGNAWPLTPTGGRIVRQPNASSSNQ